MKASCLLVDDEPLAIQLLQKHVQEFDTLQLAGSCTNAVEAMAFLQQYSVDLLFLDIQMPKLTGLEMLKALKNPPAVIITTAYREYAMEGYDLDVIDYLLKPITFIRFSQAIDKFFRLHRKRESILQDPTKEKTVSIKSGAKTYQLEENEILYVESIRDYVKLHKVDGSSLLLKYKISQLNQDLSDSFIRVHKSFLVNKNKISSYTAAEIEIGATIIPIGAQYKEHFRG
ncbi:MAG: response regulator transcription factor [Flavihumibacter sp.]|nr:response regulator transcription factor [Flavihumibacter sp.]